MPSQEPEMSIDHVERHILTMRGQKIILDADLARIYGVKTKVLNQSVNRNVHRFPEDFMFQLTPWEFRSLRSQSVTSSRHGGRRYLPYAFTEHGAIMAANVLNSERSVAMSIYVIRAFVRLRDTLAARKELSEKLAELESRIDDHDESIHALFEAIHHLMGSPARIRRRIGFGPVNS
jgi:phage regulator Rha-like protein